MFHGEFYGEFKYVAYVIGKLDKDEPYLVDWQFCVSRDAAQLDAVRLVLSCKRSTRYRDMDFLVCKVEDWESVRSKYKNPPARILF